MNQIVVDNMNYNDKLNYKEKDENCNTKEWTHASYRNATLCAFDPFRCDPGPRNNPGHGERFFST